jgi:hypothetical protein
VRLAAERGLPMLLGMHVGDEEKAEMVTCGVVARAAGYSPEEIADAAHVSAGIAQVADRRTDAVEMLLKAMPGWLKQGLDAHVTVDGRARSMRDPVAYTELLCGLHPVGTPRLCADRLAATSERTGITRFALLTEGSGDLAATEENVRRLGAEVLRGCGERGLGSRDWNGRAQPVRLRRGELAAPVQKHLPRTERQAVRIAASAVPELRRLVQQLAAHRGEAGQGVVHRAVQREHRHPVAVLEGQAHPEVPLQRTAYRVTRERTQQLAARLLVRRRRLVVGEVAAVHLQLSHQGADHLPCVGQGNPDAVDEFRFVDLASLGLFE